MTTFLIPLLASTELAKLPNQNIHLAGTMSGEMIPNKQDDKVANEPFKITANQINAAFNIMQTVIRERSNGHRFEHVTTLKPVVSCASMGAIPHATSIISKQKPFLSPIVETAFFLNQRRKEEGTFRVPSLRHATVNEILAPFATQSGTLETKQQQDLQPQLPNVIVFINSSVRRQRRPSSFCSQITMDEIFDHSFSSGTTHAEDEEEDHTSASLDIEDVFMESKHDMKKCSKVYNDRSSSSISCTNSSNRINSLLLNTNKRLPTTTIARKRSVRHVDMDSKVPRWWDSANSAKQRWMQEKKDGEASTDDDDDDDDCANNSKNNDEIMHELENEDNVEEPCEHNSQKDVLCRVANLRVLEADVDGDENITVTSTTKNASTGSRMLFGLAA